MDKNSLVEIDLQPLADVTNNLINKLADGIGWIATPRGKMAHEIEAQNYLIEQIKNDEKMPPLVKAASISNVKKLIREYTNQNNIVNEAMAQLTDTAKPEGVDNEWLSVFMDYCKNVEAENVKAIWVKVLAEECNENGSMPKKLLTILASISAENAMAFAHLCSCAVNIPLKKDVDFYELIVFFNEFEDQYTEQKINYGKLLELESMGLVNLDSYNGYCIHRDKILEQDGVYSFKYHEKTITLKDLKKEFHTGNVVFTDAGRALFSVLSTGYNQEIYRIVKKGFIGYNVKKASD